MRWCSTQVAQQRQHCCTEPEPWPWLRIAGSPLQGLNPRHLGLQFHQPFCTLCLIMGAHFIITLASGSSNSVCFIFADRLTSP